MSAGAAWRRIGAALALGLLLLPDGWWQSLPGERAPWTPAERELLRSLWIGSLGPVPVDPSNAMADDPRAARLGHRLFFDARLSGNGAVACASCHQPERRFTDGLAKARAIGVAARNTSSIIGAAYSPWLYWDGRRDSLWSQALAPLEDPDEQGSNRMAIARFIASSEYRGAYETLFGKLPDLSDGARFPPAASPLGDPASQRAWQRMALADRHAVDGIFANVGKAIAAYERRLTPLPSRFDAYLETLFTPGGRDMTRGDALLDRRERLGLELFIGAAGCVQCHNGPLLSNHEFHNTGVLSAPGDAPDHGRSVGLREAVADPFNCLGAYSDDPERSCPEISFVRSGVELLGAVRTPSLRNLEGTAPFMHKGQIDTVAGVLDHYNLAPAAMIGHNEAKPLGLDRWQLEALEAFLATLAEAPATPSPWRMPPGA